MGGRSKSSGPSPAQIAKQKEQEAKLKEQEMKLAEMEQRAQERQRMEAEKTSSYAKARLLRGRSRSLLSSEDELGITSKLGG